MQNNKLNTVVSEINEFIKNKVGLLLNDLLVQSDEYEETKAHILKLPFIQQIISECVVNQVQRCDANEDQINIKIENCELSEEITDLFFNIEDHNQDQESKCSENIYLKIEETDDDVILLPNPNEDKPLHVEVIDDDASELEVQQVEVQQLEVQQLEEEEEEDDEEEEEEEDDEVVEELVKEDVEEEVVKVQQLEEEEDVEEEVVQDLKKQDSVEEEEEDEEEGVFEIEINGVTYFTDNEKNGTIYSVDENGDPDEEVGTFTNGYSYFRK